jgi:hypothetical protein
MKTKMHKLALPAPLLAVLICFGALMAFRFVQSILGSALLVTAALTLAIIALFFAVVWLVVIAASQKATIQRLTENEPVRVCHVCSAALPEHKMVSLARADKPPTTLCRDCWNERLAQMRRDIVGAESPPKGREIVNWFLAIAICIIAAFVAVGYAPVVGSKLMYALKLHYEDPYNLKH